MSIKFTKLTKLSKILLLATAASMFSVSAKAEMMSLHEDFEDAYFSNGKNAIVQSGIFSQLDTIVGFTGFPDQHIVRDAKAVDRLYQQSMDRQSSMGTPIMTRDLANPYDTSIGENPGYSAIK